MLSWKLSVGPRNRILVFQLLKPSFAFHQVVAWSWHFARVELALSSQKHALVVLRPCLRLGIRTRSKIIITATTTHANLSLNHRVIPVEALVNYTDDELKGDCLILTAKSVVVLVLNQIMSVNSLSRSPCCQNVRINVVRLFER